MSDDRVGDVLRVCEEALAREGAARVAYLETACGTDTELRRDVEALLAERSSGAPGFLETPPWAEPAPALAVGQRLGAYEVTARLGAGGMGEVYKARDTRLERTVAIKVLPAAMAANDARRHRLEREAKAIAALSHPNIVTLYSVERAGDRDFITMEFVDGQPLSDLIPKKGLPVADLLGLAIQIADALGAAHERGIIHRDLKPSNVMVGREARAKVLDFGLARLMEAEPSTAPTTGSSTTSDTSEGHIVGTVAYMSPEQADGKPLDHRTDIFSLGILLYEMATGERPFKGDSNVSLLASILHDTPRFVADVNPSVPAELGRIIRRCLQKDRERRYQSAKDIRVELTEVKEGFGPPVPRRWPVGRVLIGASASVLLIVGGGLIAWLVGLPPFATLARTGARDAGTTALSPAAWSDPVPVTHGPGWEVQPALSPDGSLIAYSSDESGNPDIWVTGVLEGGNRIRLTSDPGNDEEPAWFPDGGTVAFASDRGGTWNIWTVPVLGGGPTLLVQDGRDPAISPDGTSIAFVRNDRLGRLRMHVAPLADTTRARLVTTYTSNLNGDEEDPAWSPDGRSLCYWSNRRLSVVSADGGNPKVLTSGSQYDREPTWSADGRFVYFSSYRDGVTGLWRIPASGGPLQRLTRGPGPERHPTVSRDGARLAFCTLLENTNLAIRDLENGSEHALASTRDIVYPSFSSDGRLVAYVIDASGDAITELWLQPLEDGRPVGAPRRLTNQRGAVSAPSVSPDGRWVAYARFVDLNRHVWIVPAAGGAPVQLTEDPAVHMYPSWSPDGRSIAFTSDRGGAIRIWTMPIAEGRRAGPAKMVSSGPGLHSFPAWSPDGRFLAYIGEEERKEVCVTMADGIGPPRRATSGAHAEFARWARDGAALIVNGTWGEPELSLRSVDLRTGTVRPFNPPIRIGNPSTHVAFDVSKDGRFIAFAREHWQGDIFVLRALSR